MANDTNWQTLLEHYESAVGRFENVSAALARALARYPADAEFLELVAVEERLRETVLLSRRRLIKHWHDSLDDTIPVRVVRPDHVCDCTGPAETVVDETGGSAIIGIYPTCSVCGVPQTLAPRQVGG